MSTESIFEDNVRELPIKVGNFQLTAEFVEDNAACDLEDIDEDSWMYIQEIIENTDRIASEGGEIYRYLFIDNSSDIDSKNLGVHWTFDETILEGDALESEIAMGLVAENPELSRKKSIVLVVAHVPAGCVDIPETMSKMLENPHEREIVIRQDCLSRVDVKDMYPEDNPYNEEIYEE